MNNQEAYKIFFQYAPDSFILEYKNDDHVCRFSELSTVLAHTDSFIKGDTKILGKISIHRLPEVFLQEDFDLHILLHELAHARTSEDHDITWFRELEFLAAKEALDIRPQYISLDQKRHVLISETKFLFPETLETF